MIWDSQVMELYKHGSAVSNICYSVCSVLCSRQQSGCCSPSSQHVSLVSPLALLHHCLASILAKQDNEGPLCLYEALDLLSGPDKAAQDHGRTVRQDRGRQRSRSADPTLRLQKWIKHNSSKAAVESHVAGQNIKIARTRFPK